MSRLRDIDPDDVVNLDEQPAQRLQESSDDSDLEQDCLVIEGDERRRRKPGLIRRFSSLMKRNNAAYQHPSDGRTFDADVEQLIEPSTPSSTRKMIKAAMKGDRNAQFALGFCFERGEGGVRMNTNEALHWYRSAALQKHAVAANNIGVMYTTGHNGAMPVDLPQALHWYSVGAEYADPTAMFHLGLAYLNGEGTEVEVKSAFKYFKQAAKKGHSVAMCNVGSLYMGGRGIEQNYGKARKWLQRAAKQGDAVASMNLAICYQHGLLGRRRKNDDAKIQRLLNHAYSSPELPVPLSQQMLQTGGALYHA